MRQLNAIELEAIYAQTLGAGMRTLALTATAPGEGVSSLALALTERHLLAGRKTLFVDLNCDKSDHLPAVPPAASGDIPQPCLLTDAGYSQAVLGVPAPGPGPNSRKWRDPGVLEQFLHAWLDEFDAVVVDAGALRRGQNTPLPAERILASCEATLLVVLAGSTTVAMAQQSCRRITDAGARLAGCVLNNRFNPSLRTELNREAGRLPNCLAPLSNRLSRWINNSRLLSLEL